MKASCYYNDSDRHACAWTRGLIEAGLITPGDVDHRSIADVRAADVLGRTRCHFFAGICGWDLALRLAGWPADREIWTGSPPCPPYSRAGRGRGDADPRNLWPAWLPLIRECRPDTLVGEQVEDAIGHGWLDRISADLEAEGYAVGAAVLGAHTVGSPHRRQRLYWVAHREGDRRGQGDPDRGGGRPGIRAEGAGGRPGDDRVAGMLGDAIGPGGQGFRPGAGEEPGPGRDGEPPAPPGPWGDFDVVRCRDGRHRRVESGTFPLVAGLSAGVVPGGDPGLSNEARTLRLRGYGNSIVPQVAAEFIGAFLDLDVAGAGRVSTSGVGK